MKILSIITCTYNSEKYLLDCIDSVKKQNLKKDDFEHIFIDGNSTDKTKEIIEKYRVESGYDVYIYEQNPKGVYSAMNFGSQKAVGEYLMWLNSDDYLENGVLLEYLDFIKKTGNKDLYYASWNYNLNGNSRTIKLNPFKEFVFKISGYNTIIAHPTVLMRKQIFFELGLFDDTKKISSDNGMWLKVLKTGKSFKCFPKTVATFRAWDGSLSTINKVTGANESDYFRRLYLPWYKYLLCLFIDKCLLFLRFLVRFLGLNK